MFQLTLKSKVAVWMSTLNVVLILLTVISLYYLLDSLLYNEMKKDLLHEANEIITQYIKVDSGRIVYQKDDNGQSISQHLLNDGSSALIVNSKKELLGAFGVYRADRNIDNAIHSGELNLALRNQSEVYSNTENLFEGRSYVVLSVPINTDNAVYGAVQVARENNLITRISAQGSNILLVIIPWTALMSVLLIRLILRYTFRSLEQLISKMQEISTNNLNVQVAVEGNPADETVRLGQTFNKMTKRIEAGVNIQKQFIADASHELITPFTRMLSSLEVAEDSFRSNDFDTAEAEISLVKNDIKELGELTQSLLLLSRLESGLPISKQKISLHKEISSIINKYASAIQTRKLKVDISVDLNDSILFPSDFFQILMSNLVSNAIKYNKSGGEITIKGKKISTEDMYVLEIKDTGKGMTTETVDRIFDRFYRGKDSGSISGSGIGMALVKRIVDITNSRIEIESKIKIGTRIVLYILLQ